VFFLSSGANGRVKLAKTGHGPYFSTLVVICVVRLLFVLFYVLFVCKCVQPQGYNPIAVNKYVILVTRTRGGQGLGTPWNRGWLGHTFWKRLRRSKISFQSAKTNPPRCRDYLLVLYNP